MTPWSIYWTFSRCYRDRLLEGAPPGASPLARGPLPAGRLRFGGRRLKEEKSTPAGVGSPAHPHGGPCG